MDIEVHTWPFEEEIDRRFQKLKFWRKIQNFQMAISTISMHPKTEKPEITGNNKFPMRLEPARAPKYLWSWHLKWHQPSGGTNFLSAPKNNQYSFAWMLAAGCILRGAIVSGRHWPDTDRARPTLKTALRTTSKNNPVHRLINLFDYTIYFSAIGPCLAK